jgi:hypothetical protein
VILTVPSKRNQIVINQGLPVKLFFLRIPKHLSFADGLVFSISDIAGCIAGQSTSHLVFLAPDVPEQHFVELPRQTQDFALNSSVVKFRGASMVVREFLSL